LELDFSEYPAIDHHVHPWHDDLKELTREQLLARFNFGGLTQEEAKDPENVIHAENTVMAHQIINRLAEYLGCGATLAEVLEVRNKRSRKDYFQYTRELMEDARVEGFFVDDGYSEVAVTSALRRRTYEDFQKVCPVWTKRVARIEPRFQDAIDASTSFEDFVERFDTSIDDAVRRDGVIAFKSIIAYRSGLNIQRPLEADVRRDYVWSKATRSREVKAIRDWYVHRVVRRCAELGVTFHIHAGVGDIDVVFKDSNPAKLYDFVHDDETRKTKIFLIHNGYPFSQEGAFFANSLKNVYIDLSEMLPHASVPGAVEKTMHILDMAPTSRVVFGSDGSNIPEIHWAGAKIGREVLQETLGTFVKSRVFDEDEAHKVAKMILSENARRVYKL
jgi:uncharacterized protein